MFSSASDRVDFRHEEVAGAVNFALVGEVGGMACALGACLRHDGTMSAVVALSNEGASRPESGREPQVSFVFHVALSLLTISRILVLLSRSRDT